MNKQIFCFVNPLIPFQIKQRLLAKCSSLVFNYSYESFPGFLMKSSGGMTSSWEALQPYGRVSGWSLMYERRPGDSAVGASWQETVWFVRLEGMRMFSLLAEGAASHPWCKTKCFSARTCQWYVGLSPSLDWRSITLKMG